MLNLQRKKQYIGRKGIVIVIEDTVPYLVRNEAKRGGREGKREDSSVWGLMVSCGFLLEQYQTFASLQPPVAHSSLMFQV